MRIEGRADIPEGQVHHKLVKPHKLFVHQPKHKVFGMMLFSVLCPSVPLFQALKGVVVLEEGQNYSAPLFISPSRLRSCLLPMAPEWWRKQWWGIT